MDNNMVWTDQTAKIIRRGEMIEAARTRRSQAGAPRARRRRLHHAALSQVGKTLSTVGGRLQDRYRDSEEHTHRRDYRPSVI
jgi:hypothetical protein